MDVFCLLFYLCGYFTLSTTYSAAPQPPSKRCKDHCGWNSVCVEGQCTCQEGYQLSTNQNDCIDNSCIEEDCLLCPINKQCKRCVHFIEDVTGRCVDRCDKPYMLVIEGKLLGKVCPVRVGRDKRHLYIILIICLGCVTVIVLVVTAICCYKTSHKSARKDRLKAMSKKLEEQRKTRSAVSNIRQMPGFSNPAYSTDVSSNTSPKINSSTDVLPKIYELKEKSHVISIIIEHLNNRLEEIDKRDTNAVNLHSNVIEQLTRVQNILALERTSQQYPEDIHSLLSWAMRIIKKFQHSQSYSDYMSKQTSHVPPDSESQHPFAIMETVSPQSSFKPDHVLLKDDMTMKSDERTLVFKQEREMKTNMCQIFELDGKVILQLEDGFTAAIEV